ncbi:TrmH family RNA methyltransferase, partial [Geminisphaera colitermitum]|uniref:TrmH family RNA methyltransferase n=1 Tax=Geminisphaera colitermitum TaxID=1148786 RepID=UPI001E5DED5F
LWAHGRDRIMLTKSQVQRLRGLREKKHREAEGVFVVEGAKVVRELLAAGQEGEGGGFKEFYVTEAGEAELGALTGNIQCARVRVSVAEMARISHYPTPSGVFAVGRMWRRALPEEGLARGLTLALDGVQDPGNVGTLLRIADWFALDRVVLSPDSADVFSQKVINASMGSFARVAAHVVPLAPALARAAAGGGGTPGVPVLGCDLGGEDVHSLTPPSGAGGGGGTGAWRDAVIVIGSEGRGLSPAVRATVTRFVTIPKYGRAESLNAGVAAGIVCAALRRGNNEQ